MTAPDAAQTVEASKGRPAPISASGARSGALLAAASAASIVAAYVFLLAAGRILGSEDYGSLAALLGLLAVVLIPAGALQMAVAREVSRHLASGDEQGAARLARGTMRLALIATAPLVALALALAVPLGHLLHIDSAGIVVLTAVTLVTALVFPVAMGVLQGMQRFHALATLYVFPWLVRLAVLAVVATVGYRLGGAIVSTVAGALAATALALALIREPLDRGGVLPRQELVSFLRYLGPVAAGLVGIALLTHVDILVVKARFSADDAGAYAAASAFARVGFFLPATILAVLFPRTAARQARGEETEDILGRSLLATISFCGALTLFYAAAGVGLVATTFGPDFAAGGRVLAPYALAIGLFSVAQVLVGYHLSRGETRYAWIVAAGVVAQIALLALVPTSLRGVVWTNVAVGAGLIAAHELLVGSSAPAIRAGLQHLRGASVAVRAVLPEAMLVLLGTTVFVCALFWPVVAHLGSTIVGTLGSDSTGSVAWFWQARHESGFHLLGSTHHTLSGAPFGWSGTNALQLQVVLPYYPTYLLAHVVGDVAAYNLTLLAGFVLSGATMYLLVRYLGGCRVVSTWAALVCIIFPWHLARAEHVSLLHIEVLALLILTLVAASRRPSWLRFGLVGAANFACWLTSGYFGAMAMVTTIAFGLGAAFTSSRRRGWLLVLGTSACSFAVIVLLGIAAIASGTNAGAGLKRVAEDLSFYGIRPVELVVPSTQNLVVGDSLESFWSRHGHGANLTETSNYLGLLTLALAVTWLLLAVRQRATLSERSRTATTGLVAAFVVGLAFALPSPVHVFGLAIPMPARLLWELVPAFRVPSRWDPLLMTALIPLAAFALDAIVRRRRSVGFAFAVIGAAMVVSFLELAIHPAEARFRTVPVPPEYAAVERMPRGILAEYPLGHSDVYSLWQRSHGRPLFNNAPAETNADYARLVLLDPSQPGTGEALSLLGVTAIAIHPDAHVDSEVDPREPTADGGFRFVGRFPDRASVWQVVAHPAGALVTLPGGFASPRRAQNGSVGYPLISSSGVGVLDLIAKTPGVVRLVFDATPPPGKEATLRVADSKAEQSFTLIGRTRIEILVATPRGHSQLLVKTDPPPASEADAIVLSVPRAEKASGEPVLHPDLTSPDPGF
jgi:O-antigen/teichoic acid export membrane protein